jgi:hypothetical protein
MTESRLIPTLVIACFAIAPLAAHAQSQLGGGARPGGPGSNNDMSTLKPPVKKPQDASSHALPVPRAAPSGPTHAPQSTARFQTIKAGDRVVDLRTAPNSEVVTGKDGRTITVERIRQLQGRIESARPTVVAKPNQGLATLAAAPAGSQVLVRGQLVRSEFLAKVVALRAKLTQPRTVKPLPSAATHANAKPDAVVGQNGLTMAEALKRPGNQVIQVGSLKYSADQLRQIDAIVKASPKDPRGLAERVGPPGSGAGGGTPKAAPAGPLKTGPRFAVTKATPIPTMLSKPDDTVLQSPGGKTITVGELKAYMAKEKLSPADLAKRFQGGK